MEAYCKGRPTLLASENKVLVSGGYIYIGSHSDLLEILSYFLALSYSIDINVN